MYHELRKWGTSNALVTAVVSYSSTTNWGTFMSKRKDAEAKIETPATDAETPPLATPATDGTQETQIALALIETLKIEPTKIELPKIEPSPNLAPSLAPSMDIENPAPLADAPQLADMPKPIDLPQPELFAFAPPSSPASEKIPNSEGASAEQPRSSRFALLAASVAVAAAIGAMTGALAAAAITLIGTQPAQAPASSLAAIDLSALHDTIGKMRSEIAALRAGVDTGVRNSNAQFAKVAERFDRIERAHADAGKLAKAQDKPNDVTGSVSPPRPPATTLSEPPSTERAGVLDGWVVRHVSRGVAVIQGRRMGVIEVERGDVVPGIGRIEAIRRQDGHWVVVTAKGLIVSPPGR